MQDILKQRDIPKLLTDLSGRCVYTEKDAAKRRSEIKELICREEYGFPPPNPRSFSAEVLSRDDTFCAGKAVLTKVRLTIKTVSDKSFAFHIYCVFPVDARCTPTIIHINFRDSIPDRFMPSEEICDNGFAVISFCYEDVTSDDGDFTNGMAGLLFPDGKREPDSPGKIAIWAWAASRVLDYALTLDEVDREHITVAGHSRLGKAALLAAALDERFFCAHSNDSGCSGAALSRGKIGENVRNITEAFPFWFCENYLRYAERETEMPFDQHFLLALLAPRYCSVGSASKDSWADPVSEYLSCVAASSMYTIYGKVGLVYPERLPVANEHFSVGQISYYMRSGTHYFSREDWNYLMRFLNEKIHE